jgi:hypothetical protein
MAENDWRTGFLRLLWIRVPLRARKLSGHLALILTDGYYLVAWPRWAAMLPLLALLTGCVIGWNRWGFVTVFSESMPLMILAAGLGILSGNLGCFFLVGFAASDFYHSPVPFRLPLLIAYALLGQLTTAIPVFTKLLLAQMPPPDAWPRRLRFGLAVAGHLFLITAMVALWVQVVPLLIRPVFTWQGAQPPKEAMEPLQLYGLILVAVAFLASLARMILQGVTTFQFHRLQALTKLEREFNTAQDAERQVKPLIDRLPPLVQVGWRTLWATFLLAGMLQFWWDTFLLLGLIFILQAMRKRLLPVPLGPWPRIIEKVPLLIRLIISFAVISYIANNYLAPHLQGMATFRPFVVMVGVAWVITFLLAPGLEARQPSQER